MEDMIVRVDALEKRRRIRASDIRVRGAAGVTALIHREAEPAAGGIGSGCMRRATACVSGVQQFPMRRG
jgi:hypothetical protein